MEQIVYLGPGRAREYDGVDKPERFSFKALEIEYNEHIANLKTIEVVGDQSHWVVGQVYSEGVDYEMAQQWKLIGGDWLSEIHLDENDFHSIVTAESRTVIIPAKQEEKQGEEHKRDFESDWLPCVEDNLRRAGYKFSELDELAWRKLYDEGLSPFKAINESEFGGNVTWRKFRDIQRRHENKQGDEGDAYTEAMVEHEDYVHWLERQLSTTQSNISKLVINEAKLSEHLSAAQATIAEQKSEIERLKGSEVPPYIAAVEYYNAQKQYKIGWEGHFHLFLGALYPNLLFSQRDRIVKAVAPLLNFNWNVQGSDTTEDASSNADGNQISGNKKEGEGWNKSLGRLTEELDVAINEMAAKDEIYPRIWTRDVIALLTRIRNRINNHP